MDQRIEPLEERGCVADERVNVGAVLGGEERLDVIEAAEEVVVDFAVRCATGGSSIDASGRGAAWQGRTTRFHPRALPNDTVEILESSISCSLIRMKRAELGRARQECFLSSS